MCLHPMFENNKIYRAKIIQTLLCLLMFAGCVCVVCLVCLLSTSILVCVLCVYTVNVYVCLYGECVCVSIR